MVLTASRVAIGNIARISLAFVTVELVLFFECGYGIFWQSLAFAENTLAQICKSKNDTDGKTHKPLRLMINDLKLCLKILLIFHC
ncbi:TPA: hypothetical protein RTG95_001392 [Campylobacter jejuni]|nr:hypothetical protein [Campylobacter jejuni]HDZ5010340.1 hypothetical protein [Campylobacter jejuni]HDZ5038394.1 hypothetical protein [Campylobacter jejuni]HDZ5047684.1 hypothetical protein [Campylobacter jejuni]HDZ5050122.1 hypothetical protein [Campylobacter jejuni]